MDLLNISLDELRDLKNAKSLELEQVKEEYRNVSRLIEEKIQLEKLKSHLNGVSADTINNLIKSMTLSPGSIDSTESTTQS